jgi:hypothetical protein
MLGNALVAVARRLRRRLSPRAPAPQTSASSTSTPASSRRSRTNNPGSEQRTHGGPIAPTNVEVTTSTFVHAPHGVLPPTRPGGSQNDCDGKGLESLEQCFGGEVVRT